MASCHMVNNVYKKYKSYEWDTLKYYFGVFYAYRISAGIGRRTQFLLALKPIDLLKIANCVL